MTLAGAMDFCPMAIVLSKLPWNGASQNPASGPENQVERPATGVTLLPDESMNNVNVNFEPLRTSIRTRFTGK